MAITAASKFMWWIAVLEAMKSKLASSNGNAGNSASMKATLRTSRARSRASAIIWWSRSTPVTSRQRSASRQASRPSPQPTSSALPQPGGTAPRIKGW